MPSTVDIGKQQVDGGYFLTTGKRGTKLGPIPECGDSEYQHCFTHERGPSDIKTRVLDCINNAQKKIFIASFRIGDQDLLEALFAAVERLHGGVYVISALDERSLARANTIEDGEGLDRKAQEKDFEALTKRGVYVRGHANCHAKFLVVDDEVAVISSANLETRAFTITGENGVVVRNVKEVDRLARFFSHLWAESTWELPPGGTYVVAKRTARTSPVPLPSPAVGPRARIIWTRGEKQRFVLDNIKHIIDSAREELILSSFSLCEMTENWSLLFCHLEKARERGVDIRILVRARNHIETHRRDALALAQMGVEVVADGTNHAKGVIADGVRGALFSANFDAQHGLTSGVEVGVRLDGLPVLAAAHRFFLESMAASNIRFVVRPTNLELSKHLAVRWRGNWARERDVPVKATEQSWKQFESAVQEGLVLFEESEDAIALHARNSTWDLFPAGNARELKRRPGDSSSTRILDSWFRTPPKRTVGVCPAVVHWEGP